MNATTAFDRETARDLLDSIAGDPALRSLLAHLEAGGASSARGAAGSSTVLLAGAVARRLGRPLLLVLAHIDDADEAVDELRGFGLEAEAFPLSTKERCPYLVFCEVAEDACADNAMARLRWCAPPPAPRS